MGPLISFELITAFFLEAGFLGIMLVAASGLQLIYSLLIGVLFIVPLILTYTASNYYVFRGKVREH